MKKYVTQCPHCHTRFRVVPDHIRISNGLVRCGHCREVFDARPSLTDWIPTPAVPAPPAPATDSAIMVLAAPKFPESAATVPNRPAANTPPPPPAQIRPINTAVTGLSLAAAPVSVPLTLPPTEDITFQTITMVVTDSDLKAALKEIASESPAANTPLLPDSEMTDLTVRTPPPPVSSAAPVTSILPDVILDSSFVSVESIESVESAAKSAATVEEKASIEKVEQATEPTEKNDDSIIITQVDILTDEHDAKDGAAADVPNDAVSIPPAIAITTIASTATAARDIAVNSSKEVLPAPAPTPVAATQSPPTPKASASTPESASKPKSKAEQKSKSRNKAEKVASVSKRKGDKSAVAGADENAATTDTTQSIPEVSFMRQARRDAFWRQPWMRVLLGTLSVGLFAGLAGQIAVHERDRIAAINPELRPWLEQLCQPLGCQINLLKQIQSVQIDSSALIDLKNGTYRFEVTLVNTAPYPVAVPAVELAITNANSQIVASTVVQASDWPTSPTQLTPRTEHPLQTHFMFKKPEEWPMSGYRVLVFYP